MIEAIFSEYIMPIAVIIGMVEFFKNIKKNTFQKKHILQIFFSLIWAIKNVGVNSEWFVMIPWEWMTMLSLTTLFWDFIFKKIRDFKKQGGENEK